MRKIFLLILIGLFLYPFASTIAFLVDQRSYAVVIGQGEIKRIISETGWHYKLPMPMQDVKILDRRTLTAEMTEPEKIVTADKKNISVDSLVRWRIVDPRLFYTSFSGSVQQAHDRVLKTLNIVLNEEIKKRKMSEVVSGDRGKMIEGAQNKLVESAKLLGIEIVDVRMRRVDYVDSSSVFEQMKADLMRAVNEQKANGTADLDKIRAEADKQQTVILAEAYRESQRIRGDGDAKASRLYAQAFGQNPEFAKFYRSLEAYRASFNSRNDVLVVDPSSEFFKYMKNPKAATK